MGGMQLNKHIVTCQLPCHYLTIDIDCIDITSHNFVVHSTFFSTCEIMSKNTQSFEMELEDGFQETFLTSKAAASLQLRRNISTKASDKTDSESESNETVYENELDPTCIMQINKRLVRIEFPGEVKNVDRAIETLGGIESIEASVPDPHRKLELHFHPKNLYNNSCTADQDFKPGILLKVNKSLLSQPDEVKYDYSVEGVSVINYSFNRLCDFQYLPLIAKQPETKESSTHCIYEKIVPSQLPSTDWLQTEESKNMDLLLLPVQFSQYDSSQTRVNVINKEQDKMALKLRGSEKLNTKQQKSIRKVFGKSKAQTSVFVNFKDTDVPTEPLKVAFKPLQSRHFEKRIESVRQLFEARPIWTKAAVRYNTGLTEEQCKIILPIVAYYFVNGPWRISWVKFGYDPRLDPKSKIYQTLDYRIRDTESTKLKVSAKRSYSGKKSLLGPQTKVSLKDDISTKPKSELDERCYVLRPSSIPPARQMFYQFCDLLLPKIQELISTLPKSTYNYCHPKNGWLPENFIETCRKLVNEHVLVAVREELIEDNKILQEKESKKKEQKKEGVSALDYCNQMLSNVKKGIYKNVEIGPSTLLYKDSDVGQLGDDMELISLSSDEENEFTVGEIIQNAIPETMEDEEEEAYSDESHSSDEAEIDTEAVEEINQMISELKDTAQEI